MLNSGSRDVCKCLERISDVLIFQTGFNWPEFRVRIEVVDRVCDELRLQSFATATTGEIRIKFKNGNSGFVQWSDNNFLTIRLWLDKKYLMIGTLSPTDFEQKFREIEEKNR